MSEPKRPILAIILEGGMVQAVVSDQPDAIKLYDLMVIDYDTDGADDDDLTQVKQDDGSYSEAIVTRPWIEKATIDLATIDDEESEESTE